MDMDMLIQSIYNAISIHNHQRTGPALSGSPSCGGRDRTPSGSEKVRSGQVRSGQVGSGKAR